ncbi:hypothetical protein KUCAC02_024427, partial [Chaenocephalus aceratus]
PYLITLEWPRGRWNRTWSECANQALTAPDNVGRNDLWTSVRDGHAPCMVNAGHQCFTCT